MFDRKIYFDIVKGPLFGGKLNQGQVDGQEAILTVWETRVKSTDLRWLAYMLATTKHETASEMLPIEEYGKGSGMSYGKKDPETGQTYYGRGYVQCTWRENYAKADKEIGLTGDKSCEWHAEQQLVPKVAAETMFFGMRDGWFRSDSKGRHTLARYFSSTVEDSFGAREIINGDKTKVPSWSGGKNIGTLISDYYDDFLTALLNAFIVPPVVALEPKPPVVNEVTIDIAVPEHIEIIIRVNGKLW